MAGALKAVEAFARSRYAFSDVSVQDRAGGCDVLLIQGGHGYNFKLTAEDLARSTTRQLLTAVDFYCERAVKYFQAACTIDATDALLAAARACESAPCCGKALGCGLNDGSLKGIRITAEDFDPAKVQGRIDAVASKTYTEEFLNTVYDGPFTKAWAKMFLGALAPTCPSCGPGRCDGTTQDCTLDSYYANPANGPRPSAGTAQNPDPLPAYGWGMWPGYTYPATKYDEEHAPPTERGPAPAVARCECGSGDHTRSGAHSHWCPCWVAP